MKRLLLAGSLLARMIALGIVFLAIGCGAGGDDGFSDSHTYTLQFNFSNSSGTNVNFAGADLLEGAGTSNVLTVNGGTNSATTIGGDGRTATNIRVTVLSASGAELVHVESNGVHVKGGKISYIYAIYDGTRLTVDATHQAGVP